MSPEQRSFGKELVVRCRVTPRPVAGSTAHQGVQVDQITSELAEEIATALRATDSLGEQRRCESLRQLD
jgi:hypothetical protein